MTAEQTAKLATMRAELAKLSAWVDANQDSASPQELADARATIAQTEQWISDLENAGNAQARPSMVDAERHRSQVELAAVAGALAGFAFAWVVLR